MRILVFFLTLEHVKEKKWNVKVDLYAEEQDTIVDFY